MLKDEYYEINEIELNLVMKIEFEIIKAKIEEGNTRHKIIDCYSLIEDRYTLLKYNWYHILKHKIDSKK